VGPAGLPTDDLAGIADSDLHFRLDPRAASVAGEDDPSRTQADSAATPIAPGGRFRILRPHAKGGIGEVFVASDAELNREVALKQIQDHLADDPLSRLRFLREA